MPKGALPPPPAAVPPEYFPNNESRKTTRLSMFQKYSMQDATVIGVAALF
jgi:hypothetical protein